MSEQQANYRRVSAPAKRIDATLVATFTASIFLSAFLLFSVQPMFTKMALPYLGGAPNVWNIALVFFQAVLLGGYIYAHLISKYLPVKAQIIVHVTIIAGAFVFLPIAIPEGVTPANEAPSLWLIGLFAASLGMPFFALSANAPLLQRWFSHSGHLHAHDPYFLYAASNLGSLLALVSYPLLFEPGLGLTMQSNIWMIGYVVLLSAIGVSGIITLQCNGVAGEISAPKIEKHHRSSWAQRIEWILIAAVPSGLMLGVTSHLSANVASAPFLWVGPLALYLLTFIIAFSKKPAIRPQVTQRLFPFVAILGLIYTALHFSSFWLVVAVNLIIFFVIAMNCHHRLAALRPPVAQLTEFYLAMSLGGVIGGAFTALVAPVIFNDVYEYPLLIVASALIGITVMPKMHDYTRAFWAAIFIIAPVFPIGFFLDTQILPEAVENPVRTIVLVGICIGIYRIYRNKVVFAASLAAFLVVLQFSGFVFRSVDESKTVFNNRNFFGVINVYERQGEYGAYHLFTHGDTNHNVQLLDPDLRREPLLYYSPGAPFAQAISATRQSRQTPLNVAIIGLGAGAVACYAKDGEEWVFFEIDPTVVRMALDPSLFTYMSDCQPNARIEIGDARLKLKDEQPGFFDLIMVDAFSSDSIPTHLLTREALALYRSKLNAGGFVFFHTSNRAVDVTSVAASLVEGSGLSMRAISYSPPEGVSFEKLRAPVRGVIVGDEKHLAEALEGFSGWKRFTPHEYVNPWTDDYSHILGAIAAKADGGGEMSE